MPPVAEARPQKPTSRAVSAAGAGRLHGMNENERCRVCDRQRDTASAPMLWVLDRRPGGGSSWLCPRCARENLRAIESKLPDEWW